MTEWTVTPDPDDGRYGRLTGPLTDIACTLGRAGMVPGDGKREGDGATPAGWHPVRRVLYRPDRVAAPVTGLPVQALSPQDGWCDDPMSTAYNMPVRLPVPLSHETLWRDDNAYDLLVVLGYNDDPPIPGLGSAIFLHCLKPDNAPTEGCIAVAQQDLVRLLRQMRPGDALMAGDADRVLAEP
ncbi:L,D-transpeptidase family protein [Yunchengibacter salinarum]|uniref:L,D-transpeptidase family protein n=1 Tax=Yunchengibacter salinarum TaxID=3133399 RepID=UPI0035B69DCE